MGGGDRRGDAVEAPEKRGSDTGDAGIARDGQEKPQDLKDKDQKQAEQRKLGKTPSSADLPPVEFGDDIADAQSPGKINTDARGNVTAITRPDGSKTEITYDSDGKPAKITGQGGYTWTREGDSWKVTNDTDGSFVDRKTNVTVRSDGYITSDSKSGSGMPITEAIRPDGQTETTYHHDDGSSSTHRPDGSSIDRRKDGSSTEWIPEGDGFRQIETSKDGKVREFPAQTEEQRRMAWRFDGPQRPDGTQFFENANGDRLTVFPNGDGVIHHKDGRREELSGKKK